MFIKVSSNFVQYTPPISTLACIIRAKDILYNKHYGQKPVAKNIVLLQNAFRKVKIKEDEMKTVKGFIFDFNRTLYDPENDELINGSIKTLKKLLNLGYKLCLLSKKTSSDRRLQISRLGLDKYFVVIMVIDGDKRKQSFQECIDLMRLKPEQIAVIGDRVRGEIKQGNKLGMKTVWFKAGKFSNVLPENNDEEPDYTILKLDEITNLI